MDKKIKLLKIAIIFTFIYSFISLSISQSQNIKISLSPKDILILSGSSATISVKIENYMTIQDEFDIFISGSYPYSIDAPKKITVDPNSSVSFSIIISSPKTSAPGSFHINVSAVSKMNSNIWGSDSITIKIVNPQKGSYFHEQPPLHSLGPIGMGETGINFYSNPRVIDRGYVIKNGEECCVGSEMRLDALSLLGEWFSKGGPNDSPPIKWVENLSEVKEKINSKIYSTETYEATICSWRAIKEKTTGPERCKVWGSLICSSDCKIFSDGGNVNQNEKTFKVSSSGIVSLNFVCPVECIFFVDRRNKANLSNVYGYLELGKKLPELVNTLNLKAVEKSIGPDLELKKATITSTNLKENEKTFIKMIMKNSGDMTAKIDKINLNLKNYEILYSPKELAPNEETEIIIKARAENVGTIKANIEYRSEMLGCLPTKNFTESFSIASIKIYGKLEKCSSSSECKYGETCCEGYCMNLNEGFCDDINGDGIPETWIEYR